MALRLLAGPFDMRTLDGELAYATTLLWVEEFDGILCEAVAAYHPLALEGDYGASIMQLDGSVMFRNNTISGNGFVYDHGRKQLSAHYSTATHRGVDWWTLRANAASEIIADPSVQIPVGGSIYSNPAGLLLADRRVVAVRVAGASFTSLYNVNYPPNPVATKVLDLPLGEMAPWVGHKFTRSGNDDRTAFLIGGGVSTAQDAWEYDFVANQMVGWVRRLGDPTKTLAGYAPKLGVWFATDVVPFTNPAGNLDHYTRLWVYADEAVPVFLSNPVALTPPRSGEVNSFQIRLTGAEGEPCAGHRINWSASARGTVLDLQTVTDADGYAQTRVSFTPRSSGPQEGVTITAEVTF